MTCDDTDTGDIRMITQEEHLEALADYERRFPATFQGKVIGFRNMTGWSGKGPAGKVSTLDIEPVPVKLAVLHNTGQKSVLENYRKTCLHACPGCFDEQKDVFGSGNRIMAFEQLKALVLEVKKNHPLKSVKFLGPGELLMNPDMFKILDFFREQGIQISVFTKGAILGHDGLAEEYQGMSAKALVDKLASYENVSLAFSFQSFHHGQQDDYVTMPYLDENGKQRRTASGKPIRRGMAHYSKFRDLAIENIRNSAFFKNGMTERMCMINAPITPENIDQAFGIYKFFIERGTPIVMTPTMVSGRGLTLEEQQKTEKRWVAKLVELYAKIYAWNIEKGVQTAEQVAREGVASYVGSEPCNQATTGSFIRANGDVDLCPGRRKTFGNLFDENGSMVPERFEGIWQSSENRKRAESPEMLVNNKCPAKDGRVFPRGFYGQVLGRIIRTLEQGGRAAEAETIKGVIAEKKHERMERMAGLKAGAPSARDAIKSAPVGLGARTPARGPKKSPPAAV